MADEDRRRAGAHTAGDRGDGVHDGFYFVKGYIADAENRIEKELAAKRK